MPGPVHPRWSATALLGALCLSTACSQAARADQPQAGPEQLGVADVERWRCAQAWHSQEELLQFFADQDPAFRRRARVDVDGETLARMGGELTTLFPLGSCTGITYRQDTLVISFSAPQRVAVPGAFHQAFLAIPATMTLQVVAPTPAEARWRFVVRGAPVLLTFSWLAELVGPDYVRDFPIDALHYQLDEVTHTSSLLVENLYTAERGGEVRINGLAPADQAAARHYLQRRLADLGDPDAGLAVHDWVAYHESFAFNLETRRLIRTHQTYSHVRPAAVAR